MPLSALQKERYYRQIIMKEIGEAGQERLLNSRVLVIGAGGLGSSVLYYLAAAGIGKIGIVDRDRVEISNLQRQILYGNSDIGKFKADLARERLLFFNPGLDVATYSLEFNEQNGPRIVADYDMAIAAVDNIDTRYLINEICFQQQKPWVEGAVNGFMGYVTTFLPPTGPCYQCLFPKQSEEGAKNKAPIGVIGTMPGIIGMFQANEVIKGILKVGHQLNGKLLVINGLTDETTTVKIPANPGCPACGSRV